MLTFDHRDFTKSAWSLAAGMLGVALLAAWRSHGDIPTISLTLGLPIGVLAFWGVYSLRMKRIARDLGFDFERSGSDAAASNASSSAACNFNPKLLKRATQSAHILGSARHLPRFRCRSRIAPLASDSLDLPTVRDQWHM